MLLIVVLVVIFELGLRWWLGFGNPLVYVSDDQIGYLLAPNQATRRFGNRIRINQYSMRGEDIEVPRPGSTLRILLLGDSIANGGWWTDQEQTISARLQTHLQQQLQSKAAQGVVDQVEVLNASANSWGPRNELAYLQKFGHFEAQAIILLLNTDDLFATAPSAAPVGLDRNYPDRKPPIAIAELYSRYLQKPTKLGALRALQEEGDRVGANLQAIQHIRALAHTSHALFVLAMTPLLRELGESGPRDYEQHARQRLIELTQMERIPYLDFLPVFNQVESPNSLYSDHIHLTPDGNERLSQSIAELLAQLQGLSAVQPGLHSGSSSPDSGLPASDSSAN
nr:GDSL-type esterase/lipase family protein [Oculatella sp. LEGE 06141]